MSFIRGLLAVVLGAACAAEETLNTEGPHGAPYVLDGDIQVPVDEYLNRHADALGAEWGGKSRRWAGGKVRYAIATNYTNPFQPAEYYLADDNPNIAWAVAHIEEKTCIRMSKCDSPFTCETPFIVFVSTFDTCSSPLGNTGGINQINLDIGCNRGTVVHEIYHSLGVQHEQKRRDRDEYVFVNMSNVLTKPVDRRFQFYKLFGGRDLGPYDYGSIMHYGSAFFHIDPAYPTIVAPLPIGQSTALSQGDIDTIQFMYNECSDEFEAPVCMANKDEDTVYEARSNLPFSVQFSVEWEAGGTVTVDYALTTTPEFTTLAAQGSSMGDSSNTEIFFTPSDSTVGNTYTMGATFTANTDAAPSTTCSITVKVVQGPDVTPAPCFVPAYGDCHNGKAECCQDGSYCKELNPYYSQCVLGTPPDTASPPTVVTPAPPCASTIQKYGECTEAPDCCAEGTTCNRLNAYYSQCL